MSTGFFMGIKNSFIPEAKEEAQKYINAINKVLKEFGMSAYVESDNPIDVYENGFFGKSGLDHHSSSCLANFAKFYESKINIEHLELVKLNPYRVAFLPINFEFPFVTDYKENFFGNNEISLNVGSSYKLKEELTEIGKHLGIEFENGHLIDEQANKINNLEPFDSKEPQDLTEDLRSPWLVLFEGARLSIENNVALSLAG